jgi:hypothetical protein
VALDPVGGHDRAVRFAAGNPLVIATTADLVGLAHEEQVLGELEAHAVDTGTGAVEERGLVVGRAYGIGPHEELRIVGAVVNALPEEEALLEYIGLHPVDGVALLRASHRGEA